MMLIPCVVSSMLMPFSRPVVTVADAHGTDAHKPDSDAVTGIHAVDTMPMAMRGVFYADAVFVSCGDCCRCPWD